MTVLDYIIDGIEAELALERELGVRFVEVSSQFANAKPQVATDKAYAMAFLHDGALSAEGVEMMAKIFGALGLSQETTPIVTHSMTLPKAKVYVVMGIAARNRYFPGLRGSPGVWMTHGGISNILITYSPEYILKQGPMITPALDKIKHDFWRDIKSALQRMEMLQR